MDAHIAARRAEVAEMRRLAAIAKVDELCHVLEEIAALLPSDEDREIFDQIVAAMRRARVVLARDVSEAQRMALCEAVQKCAFTVVQQFKGLTGRQRRSLVGIDIPFTRRENKSAARDDR